LFGYGGLPEPDLAEPELPEPELPEPSSMGLRAWMGDGHHTREAPEEHMCTCGRVREVCVRDEVRALWHAMVVDSPPTPPKS